MNTPHLNISLLSQAQSQKEVTINLALQILEMLLNTSVISMALSTPPGSPAEGDLYVIATSPTGAWSGQAGKFAYYINDSWLFIIPLSGIAIWCEASSTFLVYNGSNWVNPVTSLVTPSFSTLGVNATPDNTNKLAIASDAVLFNHNGNGIQAKLNKHTVGDTASFLFQTNFSGRAEFGLIGDDNFQLKVSPDGSSFYQSWVIDKSTGNVDFKQAVAFEGAMKVAQGSNKYMGTATLSSGTVTVNNTSVASNSLIFLSSMGVSGTPGVLSVGTITAATSFVINSSSGSDNSTIAWWIINPA